MGEKVFADGMEIAAKSGSAKVIAAFPDVCMSPPPPPTGPVPVPYPNTSKSADLKKGSKKVKIGGKPISLKSQSYYKTSPLGNEAATRNFGAAVVTHQTTGKTYFQAYSMDVKVEGKNVNRHVDITTSNHGSYPGSTPPFPNMEKQIAGALEAIEENKCPCCRGQKHVLAGEPTNMEDWYLNQQTTEEGKAAVKVLLKKASYGGRRQAGCYCLKINKRGTKMPQLLPEPPCDVFYEKDPNDNKRASRIEERYAKAKPSLCKLLDVPTEAQQAARGINPKSEGATKERQINHLTPKSAGGCPGVPATKGKKGAGTGNLQAHNKLCSVCKGIDAEFSKFQ